MTVLLEIMLDFLLTALASILFVVDPPGRCRRTW